MVGRWLLARLRTLWEDTGGSVSVEFIIMAPIVFWAYASMFSWFDAYRQVGVHEKAAFTIADMISRETTPLDAAYIDAAQDMVQFLTRTAEPPELRVSVLHYSTQTETYNLDWSESRGALPPLRAADVRNWHNRLPLLVNGERLILVETQITYTPPFLWGLMERNELGTFVFARPRFAPQLCWESC
ncbi:hypothetical protein [uncultured Lentibacter sp.]|mgnify:CR=1 FL=1|jgi:hypothetical protein|uniref:TadE/TadG family type IV pilus assembly protein n=1 Tax=uncultured Lentibacter sp. TaxID=1659309 RepID=UPI00261C3C28|nr:hypothetical protein [uncultured Lentibacter sp.]